MEQNNYFTIPQIAKAVEKNDYMLVECLDQTGHKVIPGHPANVKPHKWILGNLKKWATRPQTKPGPYYVYCYPDQHRKMDPDTYPLHIGPVIPNGPAPIPPVNLKVVMPKHQPISEPTYNPLTFENYNLLMNQISDLKTKVVTLEAENKRLLSENSHLNEESKTHLSEKNDKDFFASLMPIADIFLQERQQNRMIGLAMASVNNPELAKILPYLLTQPQTTPLSQNGKQPGGMPPPATQKDETLIKANKFIKDELTDEEYKKVEAIRNANPTLDGFYNAFMNAEPELYQRMFDYCNKA